MGKILCLLKNNTMDPRFLEDSVNGALSVHACVARFIGFHYFPCFPYAYAHADAYAYLYHIFCIYCRLSQVEAVHQCYVVRQ